MASPSTTKTAAAHATNNRRQISIIWLMSILTLTTLNAATTTASQDVLPHPCDVVRCPHMSEITCPEDSSVRDTLRSIALLHAITAAPAEEAAAASSSVAPVALMSTTDIAEELYAQCCLAKKCLCKTCYVPDCAEEGEVVVELVPESMETPGRCCGQYECRAEPNCTDVRDTDGYWLANCQRCKCYSGERICHQSCDEGSMKKSTPMCKSKNLNRFFEQGKIWRDGCYECKCVNGEENCVLSFCRSVNCPLERQVMLKDHCCPVCWPEGNPMPNTDGTGKDYGEADKEEDVSAAGQLPGGVLEEGDDVDDVDDDDDDNHIYDEDDLDDVSEDDAKHFATNDMGTLPHINFDQDERASTTVAPLAAATATEKPIVVASTATSTTPSPALADSGLASSTDGSETEAAVAAGVPPTAADAGVDDETDAVAASPCQLNVRQNAPPATYQVYPEVVEVVRPNHQNDVLYSIIVVLALAVIALAIWNRRLRNKQRSYTPVSNVDDNFNKMSSNIKKKNEFV